MTLEQAQRAKEILGLIDELEQFKKKLEPAKRITLWIRCAEDGCSDHDATIESFLIRHCFDIREHLISDIDCEIANLNHELKRL